jgi:hypothetical protein
MMRPFARTRPSWVIAECRPLQLGPFHGRNFGDLPNKQAAGCALRRQSTGS